MLCFGRILRLCASILLALAVGRAWGQNNKAQFLEPLVEPTSGRVTAVAPGTLQPAASEASPDLVYVNAAKLSGSTVSVTAGLLLNRQGFTNLIENQVTFQNVLGVAAAVADLNADGQQDLVFGLGTLSATAPNFCVYYGTGAPIPNPEFLPAGQLSGCVNLQTNGGVPNFAWIAAAPFTNGALPQVFLVDRANNLIYVVGNNASPTNTGVLTGFHVARTLAIPAADGAGPIFAADLNRDGKTDLVINNLGSNVATVYLGNGDGSFGAPVRYGFDHGVHSLVLADMNGDGVVDMVVEGDGGGLEIFLGNGDGTFAASPVGTFPATGAAGGGGGHLAAVGDVNRDGMLDILTATPAGMSVLLGQPGLKFTLKGIYNVGPGRSTFVLADFNGDGNVDVAVDSAEGVAIVPGDGDGTFRTSAGYAVGAPALGAVVGSFRDGAHNPNGDLDVAVATGLNRAQVMLGDGAGGLRLGVAVSGSAGMCAGAAGCGLWSNVLAGDFDGDGAQDLLFSATGLPLPAPGMTTASGLGVAYGNGDGTFGAVADVHPAGAPGDNDFAGETVVADLNGDGIPDVANIDQNYYDTLLGQRGVRAFGLGLNVSEDAGQPDSEDLDSFSQVAAGTLVHGADLLFQDDANLIPFVNSGDGVHFQQMAALPNPPAENGFYENTVLIADIDGDGHGDVIVPYHRLQVDASNPAPGFGNELYIWYGNGDGTFQQPVVLPLARNFYLAQVADMDQNGLPDLVLSDGYVVGILYNNGNRSFGVTDAAGVTETEDFLAGQGINSISVADVNHDGAPDVVVANGGVTISAPVVIGGLTQTAIALTPNGDVNTGGITVLLNAIQTRPVTGTLVTTPDPSKYQAAFTATATLNPSAGVPVPTGTVQFAVNGVAVGGPVALQLGTGFSTAAFTAPAGNGYQGTTALSAMYSGDARNSPLTLYATQNVTGSATTASLALCVGPAPGCPINVQANPNYVATLTMFYGQDFNGSAAASATDNSVLDPASLIAFNDAFNGAPAVTLCTVTVTYGSTCPPAIGITVGTGVGVHVFTAMYLGDSTHAASPPSPSVTLTVMPDVITGYTLISSANPSPVGQPVTFTATLTGNYAPPTGTYSVLDGGTAIGTITLVPVAGTNTSTGTFTTSALAVGTHAISAPYPGNADFGAAAGPVVNEVISAALASVSTLTSSVNPSVTGQAVTFTDTVAPANGAGGLVATGTVTFYDGTPTLGAVLGTATLNGAGMATFTTSGLTAGMHTISAVSAGSATVGGSAASLLQVVMAAAPPGAVSFSVTATPNPVPVGVGSTATVTVTVAAVGNGSLGAVTLTCAGLPYETGCRFTNAVVPAGGGTTTMVVSATAPHTCGSTAGYFVAGAGWPGSAPWGLPVAAGVVSLGLRGRRRWLRALVAVAAVAGAFAMNGCGTCTDLGTRPATYTIQVNGAAGAEVEGTPVVMQVHL